jgi:hypothetical protein
MENDFRGLEDLIKIVVQESDCPFSRLYSPTLLKWGNRGDLGRRKA